MAHFIEINPGLFIRTDVIAAIQFRSDKGGGLMATVITTIASASGTVHYDVRDPDAIAELEVLIVDPTVPNPRGAQG